MDARKHLVVLLAVALLVALGSRRALSKGLKVVGKMALESRDVDGVGASDSGFALSGVHSLDIWLGVISVELRDADSWRASHVDSLVGVDGHLWGRALVSGRHAGGELRLDIIVASPEVSLASLVASGNGSDGRNCSTDQSQWAGCDWLSEAEGSDVEVVNETIFTDLLFLMEKLGKFKMMIDC